MVEISGYKGSRQLNISGGKMNDESGTNLKWKIAKSMPVASARQEARIAKACNSLGLSTVQSAYYTDLLENKLREIDVSASMRWWLPECPDSKSRSGSLTFLIEAKSMEGFHLIFDDRPSDRHLLFQIVDYCGWAGYLNPRRQLKALEILERQALSNDLAVSILDHISSVAHPDETVRVRDFMLAPAKVEQHSGAFRETNVKNEKELENSVLWRACRSLRSAVDSSVESAFDHFLDDFETDAFVYRKEKNVRCFDNAMEMHASTVSLFHPVAVTNAHLWVMEQESGELREVPHTRLLIQDVKGAVLSWFDVVQSESFEDWMSSVCQNYVERFEGVGCKRMN